MLKHGDIGSKVSEVQKLLSFLGYDLIVDGHFGDKTLRSVKAFQKKMNLTNKGLVDSKTLDALKFSQKRTSKENSIAKEKDYKQLNVIKDFKTDHTRYVKQSTDKDKLVIRFVNVGKNTKKAIVPWTNNQPLIPNTYVIGIEEPSIYEAFNPDYWSWHLGVKNSNGILDKKSISIGLCSFGCLDKDDIGYFYLDKDSKNYLNRNEIRILNKDFRGKKYFYAYLDNQISALEKILEYLIESYNIKIQEKFDLDWFEYNDCIIKDKTPGIWSSTSYSKDKLDLYPDERIIEMLNRLAKKYFKND